MNCEEHDNALSPVICRYSGKCPAANLILQHFFEECNLKGKSLSWGWEDLRFMLNLRSMRILSFLVVWVADLTTVLCQVATGVSDCGIRPHIHTYFRRLPKPLADLMEACWSPDPSHRPTFSVIVQQLTQISQHVWLRIYEIHFLHWSAAGSHESASARSRLSELQQITQQSAWLSMQSSSRQQVTQLSQRLWEVLALVCNRLNRLR